MATRMKMLKLIEEMRGFDDFANRRAPARPQPGLLALPLRMPFQKGAPPKRKRVIAIRMQGALDIPHEVKVTVLPQVTASLSQNSLP